MDREKLRRFGIEFAPRIASRISSLLDADVHVEVIAHENGRTPARVRVSADRAAHGNERFERYLQAIPAKLTAWQGARDVDLESRSQAEFAVLIGGLDFGT
ncbi:DUF5594 family protein [Caballeronia telluris]|uniref:DUF5594 domain-containing protein n=1 Tax=Caballeronia telluris TaxID=326475 RepID=A0A158HGS7_9BURK|nr:DUF5594 family protein [Caballeronia telluris]SAL42830.1 hypothetical protein AWB66_02253 [Caballeronia telluris]